MPSQLLGLERNSEIRSSLLTKSGYNKNMQSKLKPAMSSQQF